MSLPKAALFIALGMVLGAVTVGSAQIVTSNARVSVAKANPGRGDHLYLVKDYASKGCWLGSSDTEGTSFTALAPAPDACR
jgi:hypothetical protein